jgi:phasin
MAEATKTKAAKAAPYAGVPAFEFPKFDVSKFEMPKMEVPTAVREWAEKGVAQAKDGYEKMKNAAEEATEVLEDTYATAAKGCTSYNLKLIEATRVNTNAAFDFAGELLAVRSLSEVMELTTAHARKQFETYTAQAKELSALAQKVAAETSEPIKTGVNKALRIAA